MQVILLERIDKLGQMGDVVNVKPGYARNFLLPQQKALRATKDNLSQFEAQKAKLEAENSKQREGAASDAEKLDGKFVALIRQAGEAGQLYGSVSARDIADAASEKGVAVDRRQVRLDQPIKALGLYPVRIDLHPEVSITVTANVARSAEEAATQEKTGVAVSRTDEEQPAAAEPADEVEAEKIFDNPEEAAEKLAEQAADPEPDTPTTEAKEGANEEAKPDAADETSEK